MTLEEKIKDAEVALKLGAEMSLHYYNKPLIVTYSGGKDSDVMLDIARKCLKVGEFEVQNSHTTVDAPETVYHIRDVFKELEAEGIHTEITMPKYKGEPTSMWKLIAQKGTPPTRIIRYCCQVLKETSTPHRMVALGVREDESSARQGRDTFATRDVSQGKSNTEWRSLDHTYAMYQLDKNDVPNTYECEFIKSCKKNRDTLVQPIYKFTEKDIWDYIHKFNVKTNPLYAKGYKRVGCIGCPMGGAKQQRKEFKDYPKFKENYIRAFDRMLKAREERGLSQFMSEDCMNTGEMVMRWWLGEDPKQVTFDDLFKENGNED